MTELVKGALAPDFTLDADSGEKFTLSGYRGKAVVLFFYPEDNTPGCTIESRQFTSLQPDFTSLNTVVAGISPDSIENHCKFRADHDLDVLLLADPDHIAIEAYGVWGEKTNFGKTYMGLNRTTFLIAPDGTIAQVWKVSKAEGHAADVLEATKDLQG